MFKYAFSESIKASVKSLSLLYPMMSFINVSAMSLETYMSDLSFFISILVNKISYLVPRGLKHTAQYMRGWYDPTVGEEFSASAAAL